MWNSLPKHLRDPSHSPLVFTVYRNLSSLRILMYCSALEALPTMRYINWRFNYITL